MAASVRPSRERETAGRAALVHCPPAWAVSTCPAVTLATATSVRSSIAMAGAGGRDWLIHREDGEFQVSTCPPVGPVIVTSVRVESARGGMVVFCHWPAEAL